MTDAAQQPTPAAPIQDAQTFIDQGFDRARSDDRASEVEREQLASTAGQQASTVATDPQTRANAQAVPNAPNAPQGQGQAVPPADANAQPPAQVPASRLKEEADRRRAAEQYARDLERQFYTLQGEMQARASQPQQQQQQAAPPVDPNPLPQQFRSEEEFLIADPKGYAQWMRNGAAIAAKAEADRAREEVSSQLRDISWQNDDIRAKQVFGEEFVESVKAHVKANPQLARHFSQFKDPYTKAAQWAREQQVRQAIPNGDVNAAKANWYRDLMANPELQKALGIQVIPASAAAAPTPSSVPPSLGAISRSAGQTGAFQSPEDHVASRFAEIERRRTG